MNQSPLIDLIKKNFTIKEKVLQSELTSMTFILQNSSAFKQYRIVYAFYLMAKGRSYSVVVIRKFVLAICMFVWAHFSSLSHLKKFFAEFIDSIIEEDAQLPSIQRFFPEYFSRMKPNMQIKSYARNTENLFEKFGKSSAFGSITSLLSVYAGINEEDLLDLLEKLGELVRLRDFELAYRATTKSLAAGNTRDIDSTAVAVIEKNVKNAHLLATFEKYSLGDENLSKDDAKELFLLANRYDILTGIEKNIKKSLSTAPRVIADIVDVFADFQQSVVRKKFQKVFVNRIEKYFSN